VHRCKTGRGPHRKTASGREWTAIQLLEARLVNTILTGLSRIERGERF
jgi:hypothetical protein